MEKLKDHFKSSVIGSSVGMVSITGMQYITAMDSTWKMIAVFAFMTVMGTAGKFLTEWINKRLH